MHDIQMQRAGYNAQIHIIQLVIMSWSLERCYHAMNDANLFAIYLHILHYDYTLSYNQDASKWLPLYRNICSAVVAEMGSFIFISQI